MLHLASASSMSHVDMCQKWQGMLWPASIKPGSSAPASGCKNQPVGGLLGGKFNTKVLCEAHKGFVAVGCRFCRCDIITGRRTQGSAQEIRLAHALLRPCTVVAHPCKVKISQLPTCEHMASLEKDGTLWLYSHTLTKNRFLCNTTDCEHAKMHCRHTC